MLKVIKPVIGGHDGSSFRELLDLWAEHGLCEIVAGPSKMSSGYTSESDAPEIKCWVNEQGDILLYDFPKLDKLKNTYNLCLFANAYLEGPNNKRWIFWPRHSRILNDYKKEFRSSNKIYNCVFIGSGTNPIRNAIAPYWSKQCDFFDYKGKMSHVEYLNTCSSSRFGLCLPGVGPKCLRDVEYMGMGVVPIVVDRTAMDYYDKPVEGEHYIFVKNAEEMKAAIEGISQEKFLAMSNACIDWFERNCSIHGSFKTTLDIIN